MNKTLMCAVGCLVVLCCIAAEADFSALAVAKYKESAERGDAEGQYLYGKALIFGMGVQKDSMSGFVWAEKSAKSGNAAGMNLLGLCLRDGYGCETNREEGVKWFLKAAQKGNAKAECNLGDCYTAGFGVQKDSQKANEWYGKAAEKGFARAQTQLARAYYYGNGVKRDVPHAIKLFSAAAENGDGEAMCALGACSFLGTGVPQNYVEAFNNFSNSAAHGCTSGMNYLGYAYHKGMGVRQDVDSAVHWYEQAVRRGHAGAMYNLSSCYANGDGVIKDARKALSLIRMAKDLGDRDALRDFPSWATGLGKTLMNEPKTFMDVSEGLKALSDAADADNSDAMCELAVCYREGRGVEKDLAKHLQLLMTAVALTNTEAKAELAYAYMEGLGVERDEEKAFDMLQRLSRSSCAVRARYLLGMAYKEGRGYGKSKSQAEKWLRLASEDGSVDAQDELVRAYCYEDGWLYEGDVSAAARLSEFSGMGNRLANELLSKLTEQENVCRQNNKNYYKRGVIKIDPKLSKRGVSAFGVYWGIEPPEGGKKAYDDHSKLCYEYSVEYESGSGLSCSNAKIFLYEDAAGFVQRFRIEERGYVSSFGKIEGLAKKYLRIPDLKKIDNPKGKAVWDEEETFMLATAEVDGQTRLTIGVRNPKILVDE